LRIINSKIFGNQNINSKINLQNGHQIMVPFNQQDKFMRIENSDDNIRKISE
jgi:hypothetical protein